MRKHLALTVLLVAATAAVAWAAADGEGTGNVDIVEVLISLVAILIGAKIGGDLAIRLKQPAVLGELVAGVLIGNLTLVGIGWFEPIGENHTVAVLAELGVILLLFGVGLESDLDKMLHVGLSSFLVAMLGVVAPFMLGWGVGIWFYPEHSFYMHMFLGATLTATSVGITARVLKDINRLHSREARIVLGAAVIDDVLGLIILAIVSGMIQAADAGAEMSSTAIFWLVAKAILFLGLSIIVGRYTYPSLFRVANYLRVHGMLLIMSIVMCFLFAAAAAWAGLAPIVGAFAAGLVLDPVKYQDIRHLDMAKHNLEEALEPVMTFLVPVFFVLMGIHVDLLTFADTSVLGFAAVLTAAAVIGKQVSAFGVVKSPEPTNRWIVGLGMIPRGEVGLIFAGIGLSLHVGGERIVTADIYSAVVIMVILTTLVTPPVLTWAFARQQHRPVASE